VKVRFVTSLTRGGPIEHTLYLARAMARQGIDVGAVCAATSVAERFASAGIEARRIPLEHPLDASHARRIWRYTRGADVVHAQDRRSGLWVRLGPRPRKNGLRVYTVHGLPDQYLPPPVGPRHPGVRAYLAYRGLDAALCQRADAVIVPTQAVARVLVERLRFPEAKLEIIPGGVDPPAAVDRHRGAEVVGTLTTLEPVKGLDVFLRAAKRLAREHRRLRFVAFGAGSAAGELHQVARRLGIDDRVEFPGQVSKDRALGHLDVFVLSSYMENCPMALLEAMAAGVPAVSTVVGGVPEIATDGTVQLVEPGNDAALAAAIDRLLEDPDLRERQAASARDRVLERFTAASSARSTLALYEELLEGG
jgi:glycosyltransferase involved in cell wall biosynthesis